MKNLRFITLTCFGCFLVIGLSATLLGPTFQNLAARFSMRLEDAGLFTSLVFAGSVVSILIVGRVLDRINARYALCAGVLVAGSGLLVLKAASSLPIALLGTLLIGLGSGPLNITPNVIIGTAYADRAAGALNVLNFFFSLGAIIGPQVVSIAINHQDFTLAYSAGAILLFLLVLPCSLLTVRLHSQTDSGLPPPLHWPKLVPFIMLFFVGVGSEVGFGSWIFVQLSTAAHAADSVAATATSLFWVGETISRILASLVLRRLTDVRLLALSLIGIGLGAGLLLAAPSVESAGLVGAFVVGLCFGPVFPTSMGIALRSNSESRGTVSGMFIASGTIGGVILPWLQGQIGGGTSGGMLLTLVASILLLALVGYIRRYSQAVAPSPVVGEPA